jgi:hypothetical protein
LARRDPLVHLGTGLAFRTLEQEEVTVFVDVAAAEAEVPVDDPNRTLEYQTAQPGLLGGLAQRRLSGRLVALEMALGEAPVAVRVANQQILRPLARPPAEDDSPGAHLQFGATLAHQKTEILRYFLGWAWISARSSRN